MLTPSGFRELVSGQRRGPAAAAARAALRLAEVPYTLAVTWRNRRYDRCSADLFHPGVPTISVGNLTTGGTGKTPMVEWLARWFRQRGIRVTLISRGYGAKKGSLNDEALELRQRLPDVPHLQHPDRVEAARVAVRDLDCQVIILDDAFQHRRIARDLDIVLIDATDPFCYGHLLPRGLLREPLAGLARAHVVALSRADGVDDQQRAWIRGQVASYAPAADWLEWTCVPTHLLSAEGRTGAIKDLAGRPVAAFCGIGNPRGFQHTLAECGLAVAGFREFPDHHAYDRTDMESLAAWIQSLPEPAAVVCAHKDLVKIGLAQLGGRPLWALAIRVGFQQGQSHLQQHLHNLARATKADGH